MLVMCLLCLLVLCVVVGWCCSCSFLVVLVWAGRRLRLCVLCWCCVCVGVVFWFGAVVCNDCLFCGVLSSAVALARLLLFCFGLVIGCVVCAGVVCVLVLHLLWCCVCGD